LGEGMMERSEKRKYWFAIADSIVIKALREVLLNAHER